jgi:hypothetical protein
MKYQDAFEKVKDELGTRALYEPPPVAPHIIASEDG